MTTKILLTAIRLCWHLTSMAAVEYYLGCAEMTCWSSRAKRGSFRFCLTFLCPGDVFRSLLCYSMQDPSYEPLAVFDFLGHRPRPMTSVPASTAVVTVSERSDLIYFLASLELYQLACWAQYACSSYTQRLMASHEEDRSVDSAAIDLALWRQIL